MLELLPAARRALAGAPRGGARHRAAAARGARRAALRAGRRGAAGGARSPGEAYEQLASLHDPRWGGFGQAPKFPTVPWLLFLLRLRRRTAATGAPARWPRRRCAPCASAASSTTSASASTATRPTRAGSCPHFEKMLYDQALLALAYAEACRRWGDPAFRRTALEESSSTCCATCARPRAASRRPRTPTARGRRGGSTSGRPTRSSRELGPAAARGLPRARSTRSRTAISAGSAGESDGRQHPAPHLAAGARGGGLRAHRGPRPRPRAVAR